jgi:hypothetical protein
MTGLQCLCFFLLRLGGNHSLGGCDLGIATLEP